MQGSTAGGTEVHVAGAGFAYVTQVLIGGKPCHILEQMLKDGEMTVYTPALESGRHEVEVVFTSGHRAQLRTGTFRTLDRFTPKVSHISQASAILYNVTWQGDLQKVLDLDMQQIFEDTGEKRNATEIMHAYLGTGIEILSDKAGRDEFRCDILETPSMYEGVCEVSAGTPAGYYNFTYVLENGVSGNGYGKSAWEVGGLPYVNLEGREYAIEVQLRPDGEREAKRTPKGGILWALVPASVLTWVLAPGHRVIRFGSTYKPADEKEAKLYSYLHQRADLKVSRGSIPVGFFALMPLDEGQPLYLETRWGGNTENAGPQFQISWRAEKEVIPPLDSLSDGWYNDLDDLWTNVLSYFEKRGILSEETLEYLDADPFVLFGIDDPLTQQALLKLERFPALMCDGAVPTLEEWSYYLRIQAKERMLWLVRAMMETELPKPWTCYKGIGSIVCYLRSDTGQVTWKHPFYDYFRQLRDFCRQASQEEVMQVRCNRLLWSYEATRVEAEHDHEPLISPSYVARMADIFGFDVKSQGCVVRNCKAQLKVFAKAYRSKQDIDVGLIYECDEMLQRDVAKYSEMVAHWSGEVKEEVRFDLNKLAAGEMHCVNCKTTALSFCLECKDYLCLKCYGELHSKGSRKDHAPFCLVPCALCVVLPAKIHCTFTDKSLCHKCYAMNHIKMLPLDGKENQPRRINYVEQYNRYAEFAKERVKKMAIQPDDIPTLDDSAYESVLSTDWHPFYDARGVKYYHNFATGERMRQSPRRVPNTDDLGAEATAPTAQDVTKIMETTTELLKGDEPAEPKMGSKTGSKVGSKTGKDKLKGEPLPLAGFDSLKSDVPAAVKAADHPENRLLRPPHRTHMPNALEE
ncbi:unnamed protein product [Effrenium voratum]|nr:unnamed protein product [Effrenium voratum]